VVDEATEIGDADETPKSEKAIKINSTKRMILRRFTEYVVLRIRENIGFQGAVFLDEFIHKGNPKQCPNVAIGF
jgi:hypothetical protein